MTCINYERVVHVLFVQRRVVDVIFVQQRVVDVIFVQQRVVHVDIDNNALILF